MRNLVHILLVMLCLAGCETGTGRLPADTVHTLSGNPRIPVQDLRNAFSVAGWNAISDLKYDGYVILRAFINSDTTLKLDKVVDYFPDDSRNQLAMKFAEEVRLTPTTVGSYTPPHARIYVVFYENKPLPSKAIVFAEQYGVTSTVTLGGNIYLKHINY